MDNGDKGLDFDVGGEQIRGLGSFHKTLPHNIYGEVDSDAFDDLLDATNPTSGGDFTAIRRGTTSAAPLTNPVAGLAKDCLLSKLPGEYTMPLAPPVRSKPTAAEMIELYWMALLRDVSLHAFEADSRVHSAVDEINEWYAQARSEDVLEDSSKPWALLPGLDLPSSGDSAAIFTPGNLFRLGLPGEEVGPLVSQFFVRDAHYGTQTIDQRQLPYAAGVDFLTGFDAWLEAQNGGRDADGNDYSRSNEAESRYFEADRRYVSTLRDLARFVHKDALHQAYFNATLLLLSGRVGWTPGNPYSDDKRRDTGFGVLGGPHILALVSEIATRGLKVVWYQKWQTHLRLRPEAYGGLVHVQGVGVGGTKKPYGIPDITNSEAVRRVRARHGTMLLPMAFSAGSPVHPAYGAGHATVAGACVTLLKAYFQTLDDRGCPLPFSEIRERREPYGAGAGIQSYITGVDRTGGATVPIRDRLRDTVARELTIEGELNKLASNVAMGRCFGGVHWRTDNTRSLILGQEIAIDILLGVAKDVHEDVVFTFRTFERSPAGEPWHVRIDRHGVTSSPAGWPGQPAITTLA